MTGIDHNYDDNLRSVEEKKRKQNGSKSTNHKAQTWPDSSLFESNETEQCFSCITRQINVKNAFWANEFLIKDKKFGIESNYQVTIELLLTFPMEFTILRQLIKISHACSARKMSVQIKTNDAMLLKETINPISKLFEVAQNRSNKKSLNAWNGFSFPVAY